MISTSEFEQNGSPWVNLALDGQNTMKKRTTNKEVITDKHYVDHVLSNHIDDVFVSGQHIIIYSYDIKSTTNKRNIND